MAVPSNLFSLPTGVETDPDKAINYRREIRPTDGNTTDGTVTFTLDLGSMRFIDFANSFIVTTFATSNTISTSSRISFADAAGAAFYSQMTHMINGQPIANCSNPPMQKMFMDRMYGNGPYTDTILKAFDGYGNEQGLCFSTSSLPSTITSTKYGSSEAATYTGGALIDPSAKVPNAQSSVGNGPGSSDISTATVGFWGGSGVNGDTVYGSDFILATKIPCGLWYSNQGVPGGQHQISLTVSGASDSQKWFRIFRDAQSTLLTGTSTTDDTSLQSLASSGYTITISKIRLFLSTYQPENRFVYPSNVVIPVVNCDISSYTGTSATSLTLQFTVPVSTHTLGFLTNYSTMSNNTLGYTGGIGGLACEVANSLRIDYGGQTQPTTQYVTSETNGFLGTGHESAGWPGGIQAYMDFAKNGITNSTGASALPGYWCASPLFVFDFRKPADDNSSSVTVRFTRSDDGVGYTHFLASLYNSLIMLSYNPQNQLIGVQTANAT